MEREELLKRVNELYPNFDVDNHLRDMINRKEGKRDGPFKVVLVGDGGVGKTTYVARLRDQEFEPRYTPTVGLEVHPIKIYTTKGPVVFHIWDIGGQEKFGGLKDGYYVNMDAAIVMSSFSSTNSFDNHSRWKRDLKRVGDVPMVSVVNKLDVYDGESLDLINNTYPEVCVISSKNRTHLFSPLLALARIFLRDDDLDLDESVYAA